jgi:hypothetical protein
MPEMQGMIEKRVHESNGRLSAYLASLVAWLVPVIDPRLALVRVGHCLCFVFATFSLQLAAFALKTARRIQCRIYASEFRHGSHGPPLNTKRTRVLRANPLK